MKPKMEYFFLLVTVFLAMSGTYADDAIQTSEIENAEPSSLERLERAVNQYESYPAPKSEPPPPPNYEAYPQPSYPAPAYPAPSYTPPAYPTPSYAPPAYVAPSYPQPMQPAPSYTPPAYVAPSYNPPAYPAPTYTPPANPAPSYTPPANPPPSYSPPAYPVPSYAPPANPVPSYNAPAYPAPSYTPPANPAPSYTPPAYPAPSYSPPAYPVPSYAPPAYSAPSYSPPAYPAPIYESNPPPKYESSPVPSYTPPVYPAPSGSYCPPCKCNAPPNIPVVKLKVDSYTIHRKNGDSLLLVCDVVAYPEAQRIQWLKDGYPVQVQEEGVEIETIPNSSSLRIRKVKKRDAGVYECIAESPAGMGKSKPVLINVLFKPECSLPFPPVHHVSLGERIQISCPVRANPPAEKFRWQFNHTSIDAIDIPNNQFTQEEGISALFFTPRNIIDFGNFRCWGENTVGEQMEPCFFTLVHTERPTPPKKCSVKTPSPTTLLVSCSPGEEGGRPLTHTLEVYLNTALVRNQTESKPSFFVKGLDPGTKYELVVYASNEKGNSRGTLIRQETSSAYDAPSYTSPGYSPPSYEATKYKRGAEDDDTEDTIDLVEADDVLAQEIDATGITANQ